jgi:hypothetical protein
MLASLASILDFVLGPSFMDVAPFVMLVLVLLAAFVWVVSFFTRLALRGSALVCRGVCGLVRSCASSIASDVEVLGVVKYSGLVVACVAVQVPTIASHYGVFSCFGVFSSVIAAITSVSVGAVGYTVVFWSEVSPLLLSREVVEFTGLVVVCAATFLPVIASDCGVLSRADAVMMTASVGAVGMVVLFWSEIASMLRSCASTAVTLVNDKADFITLYIAGIAMHLITTAPYYGILSYSVAAMLSVSVGAAAYVLGIFMGWDAVSSCSPPDDDDVLPVVASTTFCDALQGNDREDTLYDAAHGDSGDGEDPFYDAVQPDDDDDDDSEDTFYDAVQPDDNDDDLEDTFYDAVQPDDDREDTFYDAVQPDDDREDPFYDAVQPDDDDDDREDTFYDAVQPDDDDDDREDTFYEAKQAPVFPAAAPSRKRKRVTFGLKDVHTVSRWIADAWGADHGRRYCEMVARNKLEVQAAVPKRVTFGACYVHTISRWIPDAWGADHGQRLGEMVARNKVEVQAAVPKRVKFGACHVHTLSRWIPDAWGADHCQRLGEMVVKNYAEVRVERRAAREAAAKAVFVPTVLPRAEEPSVEPAVEPTLEESAVEPTLEEPAVEPTLEEPAVEPTLEEPSVEPSLEEPSVEPAVEEPSLEEPSLEEPAVDEPSVDEPAVEPATEELASEVPAGVVDVLASEVVLAVTSDVPLGKQPSASARPVRRSGRTRRAPQRYDPGVQTAASKWEYSAGLRRRG